MLAIDAPCPAQMIGHPQKDHLPIGEAQTEGTRSLLTPRLIVSKWVYSQSWSVLGVSLRLLCCVLYEIEITSMCIKQFRCTSRRLSSIAETWPQPCRTLVLRPSNNETTDLHPTILNCISPNNCYLNLLFKYCT